MPRKKTVPAPSFDTDALYTDGYYVPKASGTLADTLAAYGMAAVLNEIIRQAKGPTGQWRVRIQDVGSHYALRLDQPLRREWVEGCRYFTAAKGVRTAKSQVGDMPKTDLEDYDQAWADIRAYLDAQKARRQAQRESAADTEAQMASADLATLDARNWITVMIGTRQMQALSTYNDAARQWHATRKYVTTNLKALLALCTQPDVDTETVARAWTAAVPLKVKRDLTASQMLNPHQGKGQNRPKANVLAMGNESSFWLWEYLKAAGLWQCAAPRKVSNGDDRKTYVLAPVNLTLAAHWAVFQKFSERLWNDTAVKMDCVAALLYTQTLLEYSEAGQYDELELEGRAPENVVAGFHVAHYKLLSRNAYTMMNLGFIGLPGWIGPLQTQQQSKDWEEVIKEHLDILHSIDESRSDGYNLLVRYRDFLSGQQLDAFCDFAVGYSQYLTHELEQKHFWVRPFTLKNLGRMLMNSEPQLAQIVEDEGFRNIAYAIRHSTVIPQYLKAKGDNLYEVRYGLGMELKRKAAYPQEFVAALSNFIHEYNQENAQKMESKGQQRRKNIRTGDIEGIVRLVDKFGSELVCNLLIAYGYARDPREEPEA